MVGGAGVVVSLVALRGKTAHGGGYGSRSPPGRRRSTLGGGLALHVTGVVPISYLGSMAIARCGHA